MRKLSLVILVMLAASAVVAQVTIGSMPAASSAYNGRGPSTVLDLDHPATGYGLLTTAAVRWNIGCANAFKLKFVRLTGMTSYAVIAERGPFDAVTGTNVVTLSPPVQIQEGDFIAITQVGSGACGGFFYSEAPSSEATMFFKGDILATGSLDGAVERGAQLNVRASVSNEILEGVIDVAGSVTGAFGSLFRTSLQLTNGDAKAATGRIVFHPAGTSGSASDPSLPFNVPPFSVLALPDLIGAMGQSGLGSLDVISTSGSRPFVAARVFNDAGAAGTFGFTEEIVTPEQVLGESTMAWLTVPADLNLFRMNIGVRTLDQGATLRFMLTDANGTTQVAWTTKPAYAPNYFEQVSLQQFINGVAPLPNATLRLWVTKGSAVIYATTTDNRTNDSSIHFALRE